MMDASALRRTTCRIFSTGFAVVALFGWISSAIAQNFGGIFLAPLHRPVAVLGFTETYGGCPDGNAGQWNVSPMPGFGTTSTAIIRGGLSIGCAPGPNNPPPVNELYYTLTQPMQCGIHDSFSALWFTGNVSRSGSWTPGYLGVASTHNFFGPCDSSLPFSTGVMFGGGVSGDVSTGASGNLSYALWQMNQTGLVSAQGIAQLPSNWTMIGQRDFDGDGYADVLWRDSVTGTVAIWFMNGFRVTSEVSLGAVPSNWSVYGTGNLDGNIPAQGSLPGDILWRDSNTGAVAVWYMGGTSISATASLGVVPLTYTLIGDDNNGNIYWRDNDYNYAMWNVTGAPSAMVITSGGLGNVPSNWSIQGVGDFYGDGNVDILWRDSNTGTVAIWNMNGFQVSATSSLGAVPSTWNIVQTGDYNGDGTSDIMWQDGSGNLAVWYLKAGHLSSTATLGNIGTTWTVQSTNSE
jgi:FG-GAP-like repeat